MDKPQDILKKLNSIQKYQSARANLHERHFYMYGHSLLSGSRTNFLTWDSEGIKFNLIQSCSDTLVNKISKNSPRPTYITDGADWANRRKAEKREKFVFGLFHKLDVYKKTPAALLQALVFGDGLIKVYSQDKEICIENCLTFEFVVDENEALYGSPRHLYQLRLVSKDTLKTWYPDKEEIINEAQTELLPFFLNPAAQTDFVLVIERWKLPIKKNGKYIGGEHHIIVGGKNLIKPTAWERPGFPFAKIGFVKNLTGWWSKSVAEIITPHQIEVNKTLKRISDCLRLCASPKVLYEYQSKIVEAHFNNDVGAMIGYSGVPPQFVTPAAVPPELFSYLQSMIQYAYGEVGISSLTAKSEVPAGIESGRALREYSAIETERFSDLSKQWDQLHLDIADLVMWEAEDIAKIHGSFKVLSPDKGIANLLEFKDIDMDQDTLILQTYPSNMLPKEPSGRLANVIEMMEGNLIDIDEGRSLLDYPDIEKVTKFKNANYNDILITIDLMLDKGEYLPPEPYQSLDTGIKYMNSAYLYYKHEGCPEDRLELLIRWVNDALQLKKQIMQPPTDPPITSSDLPMTEGDQQIEQPQGVQL